MEVAAEGEVGVVVRRRCRNLRPEDVPGAILGWTIVNDLSGRDSSLSVVPPAAKKAADGFAPMGPYLSLDPAITRRFPIRLAGEIEFEPGYGLRYPPRLTPDTVEVRGALSVLAGIDAWPTRRIAIERLNRPMTAVVPLSDTLRALVGLSSGSSCVV